MYGNPVNNGRYLPCQPVSRISEPSTVSGRFFGPENALRHGRFAHSPFNVFFSSTACHCLVADTVPPLGEQPQWQNAELVASTFIAMIGDIE